MANPARVLDPDDRRRNIEAALAEAGWQALWETKPQDPGMGQTIRSRSWCAGGVGLRRDGTVRAVFAGMLGTDAALVVLPAGTGNLEATNLELPDETGQGVRWRGLRRPGEEDVVDLE